MIPSTAQAKVSFRLVHDQTPEGVEQLLRGHLERLAIPGVSLGLRRLHGSRPWRAQEGTAAVLAARRALACAFEHEAVIGGTGGTIPIVPELARYLDAELLLVGFGLPGENATRRTNGSISRTFTAASGQSSASMKNWGRSPVRTIVRHSMPASESGNESVDPKPVAARPADEGSDDRHFRAAGAVGGGLRRPEKQPKRAPGATGQSCPRPRSRPAP